MEKALKQRPSDCLKVVLFGPESTGKTSLCEDLARHYGASCAREYMRLYLEAKLERGEGPIEKSDLLPIAFGQMACENKAAESGKLVFCDTDLLQLKVYSQYYYNGYCPKDIRDAALTNTYHLYLLCDIDIPWEADPLRDRPFDRLTLFRIFKTELEKNNRPYQLISGGRQHRLRQAVAVIDNLLQPTC